MKATLDCLECIAQQALRAARIATDDPETQRRILNEAVLRIPGMDINESPAVLSQFVYELAKQASGQEDPYADLKRAQNEQALALEPELRAYLAEAPDPLETALHLSAAGNVIDMGVHYAGDIDIHTAIRDALHQRFAVDHSRQFRESLAASRDLLFLLDNAGEIVFDKLLIEQLCQFTAVTAVVKKAPIIILDEATSEVDGPNANRIAANLRGLGCTRLEVAHRLEAIREADEILVMDGGRIVGRGRHDRLQRECGTYRRLLERERT